MRRGVRPGRPRPGRAAGLAWASIGEGGGGGRRRRGAARCAVPCGCHIPALPLEFLCDASSEQNTETIAVPSSEERITFIKGVFRSTGLVSEI